jgi:hydrogenase maturation protease
MQSPILVIGIGNEYRSDDGVGLAAIRKLKARGLPDILLMESNGDGTVLMEAWAAATKVILIDAVYADGKPGTIHRLDALTEAIPTGLSFPSTHTFGVAEALELARALDQLPSSLMVYGIEGKNFLLGVGLSPEVENAVQEVVEQVAHEIQGWKNNLPPYNAM